MAVSALRIPAVAPVRPHRREECLRLRRLPWVPRFRRLGQRRVFKRRLRRPASRRAFRRRLRRRRSAQRQGRLLRRHRLPPRPRNGDASIIAGRDRRVLLLETRARVEQAIGAEQLWVPGNLVGEDFHIAQGTVHARHQPYEHAGGIRKVRV